MPGTCRFISGSDAKESDLTRHLTSLGAQVFYGQKAENILPGTDLVVYTAAIHPDNPEFAAAKAAGVPPLQLINKKGELRYNRWTIIRWYLRPAVFTQVFCKALRWYLTPSVIRHRILGKKKR